MPDERVMNWMNAMWARVAAMDAEQQARWEQARSRTGRTKKRYEIVAPIWYESQPIRDMDKPMFLPRRMKDVGNYSTLGHVNKRKEKAA